MRRVGAGERVHDVDVALAQPVRDLLAQPLEVVLRDVGVDVAPPDARLGAGLADDELVLGRAARVLAGVDHERSALGEPSVAARERVLVQLRRGRVPEDVPSNGDSVLGELVPIGNDRDHETSCYAQERIRGSGSAFERPRAASATNQRMLLVIRVRGLALLPVLLLAALVAAPSAAADLADEQALAERYAPIVRLVEQQDVCSYGEPFIPTDIDLLLDEETVALRGPWNVTDLVKIAPTADDLVKRFEYHLDFPGNALNPGCDYNRWAKRLTRGSKPVVYAHVVGEDGFPGKLALQYWFFYPFNDFNNTHEGDWEMIQLLFDAPDARAALETEPVEVGYSSHEGAERAAWDDEKLELVGDRPVVYPGRRFPREQVQRRPVARQLRRGGGGLRRHARPAPGGLPSRRRRSRATGLPPRRPIPGSRTRGGGASSRRLSSTARPART